nr:hypothetical protein SHINE37_41539 [Rhizobiaceae bacterium]
MNGPFKTISGRPCLNSSIGAGNKGRPRAFSRHNTVKQVMRFLRLEGTRKWPSLYSA